MQVVLNIYNFLKTTFWKKVGPKSTPMVGKVQVKKIGQTSILKKGCNFGPPSGLILVQPFLKRLFFKKVVVLLGKNIYGYNTY